jgi:microcystin degradation protein MlrC
MRIAVGQMWQETNTFNRNPTSLDDFENWGVAIGPDVVAQYGCTGELGGFLDACNAWDTTIEFPGLARFVCWPWGAVDGNAWKQIQDLFRRQLEAALPVDGVFLALHGAMAADGENDLTGALLELVRNSVGPNVPIVGTLDLHANITERMLQHADLLVGYHACPHLDSFETGQRAAAGLRQMIEDNVRPVTYSRKLPMITAAENHNTFTGIPAPLYRRLEELERDADVLSAGLYMAMPWFDVPALGWTVTLTTTGKKTRWKTAVNQLADECWNIRDAMENVVRHKPRDAVDRALSHGGHPVVIGDGADATNSGSPGDQVHLLKEFLARDHIPHGALTFLVDPEAVNIARQAGVGRTFLAKVGAGFAPEYCEPIEFRGTVERLLDVDFVLDGHIGKNMPIHMGQGAVVTSGDVTVLFVEKTGPGSTPSLYETAGLDPRTFGIVVAKSPAGFRAEYEPFAAEILSADCPGCASANWPRLNFFRVNRPLWPLNQIERPTDAKWCGSVRVG